MPKRGKRNRFGLMAVRFTLNKRKFYELARFKGWECPCRDLAAALGYSKCYISRILATEETGERLTDLFMCRYISYCGCIHENWQSLFDVIECPDTPQNSPKYNLEKLNARMPYSFASSSYHLRRKDRPDYEEEPLPL